MTQTLPRPVSTPSRARFAASAPAPRGEGTLFAAAIVAALVLAGVTLSSPWILWSSLAPALWLASVRPSRLVQLLAVTTPVFPVLRFSRDLVGAQQVSSKGLFLSSDDPIIAALGMAWLISQMRAPHRRRQLFPGALLWLLAVYPLVALANFARLEVNQGIVSFLYYLKWAEYAVLLFAIPQTIRGAEAVGLVSSVSRLMMYVLVASGLFAAYEVAESLRTGSYTQAASIPRASAFFGTMDPARYGASEDPVNFGVYAMVAGSIALASMSSSRRLGWLPGASFLASLAALLLSASRAPWLAAALAFGRIQRVGSSRLMLGLLAVVLGITGTLALAPGLWQASFSRFEALGSWSFATESSAMNRLDIAINSPVFDVDQYWLIGHGHSSYRFIAEEHLSRITTGISRSLYNFPLTVWYDSGPAGLALWILLFIQLRRRLAWIHARSPLPEVKTLAWALLAALWGLAVAAMFGESPYNWRVMGVFYLAAGVCLAADEAARQGAARFQVWRIAT